MLPVGSQAPDFTLKDQNNQEVRLAELRGRRNVLIVFYPATFTGTCRGELSLIRDDLATYQNDTVQVLAISVDSVYAHKVWAEQEGFGFPLLADFWPHGAVARAYGAFRESAGVACRATYLVDTTGVIRFAELIGPGESRDASIWRAALAEVATPAR